MDAFVVKKRKAGGSKTEQPKRACKMPGLVRVGRRQYGAGGKFLDPSVKGFTTILCLTPPSPYGAIGPYCLKNRAGHLMENIYQFNKQYASVPKTKQMYSRYSKRVIWEHPAEKHWDPVTKTPTAKYREWQMKGLRCKDAVRYPVGFHHRHECMGIWVPDWESMNVTDTEMYLQKMVGYVEGRKLLYIPVYADLVRAHPMFLDLKKRLEDGENLLIVEVDGPHWESMDYYKTKYGVADDFIDSDHTIPISRDRIDILLEDEKHPFGHGYVLAMTLLGVDREWNPDYIAPRRHVGLSSPSSSSPLSSSFSSLTPPVSQKLLPSSAAAAGGGGGGQ